MVMLSTLDAAVNQLRDAVGEFTQCVAREEDELTPKNLIGPRKKRRWPPRNPLIAEIPENTSDPARCGRGGLI